MAPKFLTLKIGAQVMLIKNLVQGELVNGSVGRVTGFSTPRDALDKGVGIAQAESRNSAEKSLPEEQLQSNRVWPVVQFANGQVKLCIPCSFEVNNADGHVEARVENKFP